MRAASFRVIPGLAELTLDISMRGRSAEHFHSRWAIGVFRNDAATHCRGQRWDIRAGNIVVHAPFEAHWGEALDGCIQDFFYVAPELVARLCDVAPGYAFRKPVVVDALLGSDLMLGLRESPERLERAIVQLFARHAEPSHATSTRAAAPGPLALDRAVATGSARAGVSRTHFSRKFRSETGLSPRDFRRQQRVLAAWCLILDGSDLAEAAARAGFSDQPHMTRQFREILGVTPGALRRGAGVRDSAAGATGRRR